MEPERLKLEASAVLLTAIIDGILRLDDPDDVIVRMRSQLERICNHDYQGCPRIKEDVCNQAHEYCDRLETRLQNPNDAPGLDEEAVMVFDLS